MDLKVQQKQEQRLTPQMVQSLEILQMNARELQDYVQQAALENPLLELAEPARPNAPAPRNRRRSPIRDSRNDPREDIDLMARVAAPREESLYDYLRSQLDVEALPAARGRAVEAVLSGLDDNGYLDETRSAIAKRAGVTASDVRWAEERIRALEPAGVGARTLEECLALQLKRRGENGLALTIAESYLGDVARHRYHHMAKSLGRSEADVRAACDVIRTLSPRPGSSFSRGEATEYVVPDFTVSQEGGRLRVTVADAVPVVTISRDYAAMLDSPQEPEVRAYLKEKHRRARWLIQGVEQRQQTLAKCARCIAQRQAEFFRGGPLHPLTMADAAEQMGVHESTVSRAIRGKYLQCDRGAYPLSFFFTRAVSSTADTTADAVCAALREFIRQEDPAAPLSDQKLTDLLARRGVTMARRTVAKYRTAMGFPPAAGRRRAKK